MAAGGVATTGVADRARGELAAVTLPYDPRSTMTIRRGVAGDRDRIQAILVGAGIFTDVEIGWAMELVDLALLTPGTSEYEVDVLEDAEGIVAGYVCFAPTPHSDGVFDLYWIAVDRASQGKGIGQELLRFVEEAVQRRSGRMLLIETSSKASYAPTVRFYEAAGYREISRIKDFYRIEEDKVVFCKHLAQA